jgi:hypothetical protein
LWTTTDPASTRQLHKLQCPVQYTHDRWQNLLVLHLFPVWLCNNQPTIHLLTDTVENIKLQEVPETQRRMWKTRATEATYSRITNMFKDTYKTAFMITIGFKSTCNLHKR